MSTLVVVEQILRETRDSLSVRQIVEHAGSRLPTRSKTPDTVVARDLSMDIKKKGEASIFIRTAPGRYAIREIYLQSLANGHGEQAADISNGSSHVTLELPRQESLHESLAQHALPPTSLISSALREERAGPLPARTASVSAEGQHTRLR